MKSNNSSGGYPSTFILCNVGLLVQKYAFLYYKEGKYTLFSLLHNKKEEKGIRRAKRAFKKWKKYMDIKTTNYR